MSAGASVLSFTIAFPGVVDSVLVFVVGVARLGLRKSPPSFEAVDFLPSPSVPSASEIASDLRSFLVPRLLKNDERRWGLVVSGVVGEATGEVTASFTVADGPVLVIVAPAVGELTESSSFGAVEEVNAVSSLTGTTGAASVVGLESSFLLKKLPKIELLLLAFGAVSRLVSPAFGSTTEDCGVSPVMPVGTSVVPTVARPVAGTVSPSVARGAPTTRAARRVSLDAKDVSRRPTNSSRIHMSRCACIGLRFVSLELQLLLLRRLLDLVFLLHIMHDRLVFDFAFHLILFLLFLDLFHSLFFLLLYFFLVIVFFLLSEKVPKDAATFARLGAALGL